MKPTFNYKNSTNRTYKNIWSLNNFKVHPIHKKEACMLFSFGKIIAKSSYTEWIFQAICYCSIPYNQKLPNTNSFHVFIKKKTKVKSCVWKQGKNIQRYMVYRTCHNKLHKQDKIMYSCKLKNKCNTPHDTIEILQVLVFS